MKIIAIAEKSTIVATMYEAPRHYPLDDYENPANEQYGEFMTRVSAYDIAREKVTETLIDVINQTDKQAFDSERARLAAAQKRQRQTLERVARTAFATMSPAEAITAWTTLVQGDLADRRIYFEFFNPGADIHIWTADETQMRAEAYVKGREKLRSSSDTHEPRSRDFKQYDGAEAIHEITDGELDWLDLSAASDEDDYAEWVHDEYGEGLEKHVEAVLAFKTSCWS